MVWQYPFIALLSPLLFVQGKYVRKTVPLLPEPSGARTGVVGTGPELKLLVLGDSAAAGVGVSTQDEALTGRLVEHLAEHFEVKWTLAAKTGFTTGKTLKMLEQMPAQAFDAVVTSLGVNDTTGLSSVKTFLQRQEQLVEVLNQKFSARHICLSGLPPVGKFPALPQPLRWALGWRAQLLDVRLQHWAASRNDCYYLKSDYTLDPVHIASDGFHPGAGVYRFWAEAVAAQIEDKLNCDSQLAAVRPADTAYDHAETGVVAV